MFKSGMGRLLGLALLLIVSLTLVACGGETPTATAVPAPTATTAPAAPAATATTAMAAPTATTAMAAPTDTAAAAAPTATTAMAAPTDTAMMAAPTATTGSSTGNRTSRGSSQFDQVIANMKALKSYHMDITTSAAGQNVTQGADVDVANNKLRLMTDTAGQQVTIVVIATDAWMSMDGGKTYIPNPAGAQTAQALGAFIHMWDNAGTTTGTATVPDAIKEGNPATEQIDGVDTKHYIVDSKDAPGVGTAGASGTVEYWISNDATPRIIQMKTTSSAAGQDSTVIIKWSKFDTDFGITAPK